MFDLKLRGAKAEGTVYVTGSTLTPASFSLKVWDSDGFYGPGSTTEVFTIPSPRRAGRYQIRVAVRWMNPWSGDFEPPPYPAMEELTQSYYAAYVTVNDQRIGNDARATANPVRSATGTTQYFAVDANLNAKDRVCVILWHGFDTEIRTQAFLEIRRLGRKPLMSAATTAPGGSSIDVG